MAAAPKRESGLVFRCLPSAPSSLHPELLTCSREARGHPSFTAGCVLSNPGYVSRPGGVTPGAASRAFPAVRPPVPPSAPRFVHKS